MYRITGLITPPKSCRASRSMQHFYINGRYVRNRTMMAGMEMAFKGTMMGWWLSPALANGFLPLKQTKKKKKLEIQKKTLI